MIEGNDIALRRFAAYAERGDLRFPQLLGAGKDGVVHKAKRNAFPGFVVVKSFRQQPNFERERAVYMRLRALRIQNIRSCHVPQLLGWNNELLAIEMTMVTPPFILDFADAYLDEGPEFSDQVWNDWDRKLEEDFGERAAEVRRMLALLDSHGVIMLDVHPGNIGFE